MQCRCGNTLEIPTPNTVHSRGEKRKTKGNRLAPTGSGTVPLLHLFGRSGGTQTHTYTWSTLPAK